MKNVFAHIRYFYIMINPSIIYNVRKLKVTLFLSVYGIDFIYIYIIYIYAYPHHKLTLLFEDLLNRVGSIFQHFICEKVLCQTFLCWIRIIRFFSPVL